MRDTFRTVINNILLTFGVMCCVYTNPLTPTNDYREFFIGFAGILMLTIFSSNVTNKENQ